MTAAPAIREARPDDADALRRVLTAAFGGAAEADLTERLGRDGDLVLTLVAEAEAVIGMVAFSRLRLEDESLRATALAPLAVDPHHQRRGVGAALVTAGLARLRAAGEDLVLVLGDPATYGRFGFRAEAARGLLTPYDSPYQQALALNPRGAAARGAVRYPPAFAALG